MKTKLKSRKLHYLLNWLRKPGLKYMDVFLYLYDLSSGAARVLSPMILGKKIDGIWHTAVVLFGKEFFFCQSGIQYCIPGGTHLGEPWKKQYMGQTNLSESEFMNYIRKLSVGLFKPGVYSLMTHNCNNFSDHLIYYLTSKHIPSYVLELPSEFLSTPLGASLQPYLNTLSVGINPEIYIRKGVNFKENVASDKHTFSYIKKSFRPIFFDEPLSSELSPNRVHLLWPVENNSNKVNYVHMLSELLANGNVEIVCTPEYFDLLDLTNLSTSDQCRTVCELFRLAVWRDPNLLIALLTDPNRHLHKFSNMKIDSLKFHEFFDVQACRAKFLANCLGLSWQWSIVDESSTKLELDSIVQLALLLINNDSVNHSADELNYSRKSTDCSVKNSVQTLLPEHMLIGLALTHNLSLYPTLAEKDALELGSYLLYLATNKIKSFKDPMENIYLLRSLYFLIVRFSTLNDAARCHDLHLLLREIMKESSNSVISNESVNTSISSSDNSKSVDYLIAAELLDYLITAPEVGEQIDE